jgi:recombinational DNA repair protein (RecF pathway)
MAKCARCGKQTTMTSMSYFNTDVLCMECDEKERAHPKFKEAQAEEEKHVRAGNYNFKGVGKPADL